jgi:hypothetical protein
MMMLDAWMLSGGFIRSHHKREAVACGFINHRFGIAIFPDPCQQ